MAKFEHVTATQQILKDIGTLTAKLLLCLLKLCIKCARCSNTFTNLTAYVYAGSLVGACVECIGAHLGSQ